MSILKPMSMAGREKLDFGRGFYVTDILEQAHSWAIRMGGIRQQQAVINVYELDFDKVLKDFSYLHFEHYDASWLQFIVANRRGEAAEPSVDVVEGGVANDRVIDTVEAYMSGLMPIDTALGRLAIHKPNNQFCLRTQSVIDQCLSFVKSYII